MGGAVRDKLLNLEVVDQDFVVVGSSPEELLKLGYKEVGKDFPVFLHPKTGEEYALARTERKSGKGYKGFTVDFSADISLEQDLMRRDLTINAIAQDDTGLIIDPHHGQTDLKNKLLRHVSPAFAEDPLRVLRVARFAARFAHLGFSIATETLQLMSYLVESGEMQHLTAERVWAESEKALQSDSPQVYFEVLRQCGALKALMPELNILWGIPNPEQWHPEIDTGIHCMMALEQASKASDDIAVRFAALVHDLGKGITPKEQWPHHRGHEESGVGIIKKMCQRLRVPKELENLGVQVSRYHLHCHKVFEIRPKTVLKVLKGLSAFRNPKILKQFIQACQADFNGRLHNEDKAYPQADLLWQCFKAAEKVDVQTLISQGFAGQALGEAIDRQRHSNIKELLIQRKSN